MSREEESQDEPRFEFGGPCPRVRPIFFPFDPKEPPREIQEGADDDTAQPSRG